MPATIVRYPLWLPVHAWTNGSLSGRWTGRHAWSGATATANTAIMTSETRFGRGQRGEEMVTAARFLSELIRDDRGWKWRSCRGWMFADELPGVFVAEPMKALVADGFATQECVSDPARRRPISLYRLLKAGENALAALDHRAPMAIPPLSRRPTIVDLETLFLPADAWYALTELVKSPESDPWRSLAELNERPPYTRDDMLILAARGLAEISRPETVTRTTPIRHRATQLGRQARLRDRGAGQRVQVRVPGLRQGLGNP